ncbi:quinolinate synthase NadA [Staphylococcus massiliensis]|uniref:Quinolinate synthase n=1 Tax=Staphylococcus massiliensis S46 TaxID=1229783 RepID=K9ARN3_9STAP|nr:quinolinate synthase NadA [Staphylococcus massiliensis]EKU50103.1 quinolinate synthetase [Staphylococcus massiliensis S46]MCG3402192.1 quinolinate synthase NadA [Staphylococcus massiliensis]MCG3412840.1 quinolinate synthase NadA [Staphylococcus massiliensis]
MKGSVFQMESEIPERYLRMTTAELEERVRTIKDTLGKDLFMPTHHYQKDEVAQFADVMGDSLELARICRENTEAKYFVFNGVHFMAETADILTHDHQKIYLPDLSAGCALADMANINQAKNAFDILTDTFNEALLPITYVNSTAEIKAFVGLKGGSCVTSGNARKVIQWALDQGKRVLFLPDQHLGRNIAFELGIPLSAMATYDPISKELYYDGDIDQIKIVLWKGHCTVHEKFHTTHIKRARENNPDVNVLVHPECEFDVVQEADYAGSTKYILKTISEAKPGSSWVIGTEMNLVNRIRTNYPKLNIESLNPLMCACLTMNRIDLPHLTWCLDKIMNGDTSNQISVEADIAHPAKDSLNRMLAIT